MKVYICKCEQCKGIKKKRKNRKYVKIVKRMINKKRRKENELKVFNFYWA